MRIRAPGEGRRRRPLDDTGVADEGGKKEDWAGVDEEDGEEDEVKTGRATVIALPSNCGVKKKNVSVTVRVTKSGGACHINEKTLRREILYE